MAARSAVRAFVIAGAQLTLLAGTVVALRGSPPAERRTTHPIGGSAAPLVVYTVAIAAAAVILVAALRSQRAVRRRSLPLAAPREKRRWRAAGWALLALAALTFGVVVLLNVLPHRSVAPPPLTSPQSTEQNASPTSTPPPAAPAAAPSDAAPSTDLWPGIFVALPVLLTLLAAGGLAARRRADPPVGGPTLPSRATAGPLARASELGLQAVSAHNLDPGAAIVACYAAMEHALAQTPGAAPHASDTPTEVLARAVEHGALRANSAVTLVELFAEARFSAHPIGEVQREAAAQALRRILDELRNPACVPSP